MDKHEKPNRWESKCHCAIPLIDRPPSQSLNSYGHSVHDDVRSPTGSTGTPGPLSQQPSSQQSTDNNSEAEQNSNQYKQRFSNNYI
ncbi:Homeobox protein Meis2 [Blomia tropicalis]|nr:Homeobox protein Meis2 [Blomia tropicalis]